VRIDTRAGSKDLFEPLKRLSVDVEEAFLDSGDVEIIGNGPDGPMLIGVEYKKLGDLIQCVRDGRFADQLRKMKENYQIYWLLVEGTISGFMPRSPVFISKGKGRPFKVPGGVTYHEIASFVISMSMQGGVNLWRTKTIEESAAWLRALNLWWTAKEWDDHRACLDFYKPPPVGGNAFTGPSTLQKVLCALPGVGPTKAFRISERFGSVREMVAATEADWIEVDGIGKRGAKLIMEAINEGDD
jgi:ERCC4-type nuclease